MPGSGGVSGNTGSGGSGGTAGAAGSAGSAGTGGSALPTGCTPAPLEESGELQGRWDSTHVTAGGRDYFMQVNEWNSMAAQTIAYGGDTFFRMTVQQGSVPTDGGPTGFPSVFIGANSGNATEGSNLPKQVSALTTVPTTWNWNDNGTLADEQTNIFNVAYDVWFSTSAQGEPEGSFPSGGFLMVWLYDPPNAQPIGQVAYPAVTIPGVPGTWDVWFGMNGSRPCISYVSAEPRLSLSFDLNEFIKDAVSSRDGAVEAGWYLTNVFIGFEIWQGSVGLETTDFCAIVN